MNGYRREELIGKTIDIFHDGPADPRERAAYFDRLRREGVIKVEAMHYRKDGSLLPIEDSPVMSTPISSTSRNTPCSVVTSPSSCCM